MNTAHPRRGSAAVGTVGQRHEPKAGFRHTVLAATVQALVGLILLALVFGSVAFDAILKLLAPHMDTFAGDARGAPSITIEITAWAGTLVGILWILDVALRFVSRSKTHSLSDGRQRQRLELAAGSALVGLGLVTLLIALDSG